MPLSPEHQKQAQALRDTALKLIQQRVDKGGWKNDQGRGLSIPNGNEQRVTLFERNDRSLTVTTYDDKLANELYQRGEDPETIDFKASKVLLKADPDNQIEEFDVPSSGALETAFKKLAVEQTSTSPSQQSVPKASKVQVTVSKPDVANEEQSFKSFNQAASSKKRARPSTPSTTKEPSPEVSPPLNGPGPTKAKSSNTAKSAQKAITPAPVPEKIKATEESIQSFFEQLRPSQGQGRKAEPTKLEIKVGRQIAYRSAQGEPSINKLDRDTLNYLRSVVKIPQADPAQAQPSRALDRAVTIKVNDEVVFRLSKGVVEINKLDPTLAQNIAKADPEVSRDSTAEPKAAQPEQQRQTPIANIDSIKVETSAGIQPNVDPVEAETAQPLSINSTLTPEAGQNAEPVKATAQQLQQSVPAPQPQLVPALDIAETEVQQQPENSVRQYLEQAVQALKTAPGLAVTQVQAQLKALPRQAVQQVAKLPEVMRDRQIAGTALKLLDQYGTKDAKGFTFQSADYDIRANGNDTYSISDKQGQELMRFKDGFLGPQTLSSQITTRHQRDFQQAYSQMQIHGGVTGISEDPSMRVRQLQGLTPIADIADSKEIKNLAAVMTANKVLQVVGSDRYESKNYVFQQRGNSLTISAKDGRGEIVSAHEGKVSGSLQPLDISNFRQMEGLVKQTAANRTVSKQQSQEFAIGE